MQESLKKARISTKHKIRSGLVIKGDQFVNSIKEYFHREIQKRAD